MRKKRRGGRGNMSGFRLAGRDLMRDRLSDFETLLNWTEHFSRPSTPSQEWNLFPWLDNWDRTRCSDENPLPTIGLPERPLSMAELYEYHKAIGLLDYFFAEICPDPN